MIRAARNSSFPKLNSRLILRAVAAAAFSAVVSATSPAMAQGITPEILAAAKAEGQVTYYTSADLVLANQLKAPFEAKYGIKVNILRLSSSVIFNRAVQEFDLGVNAADAVETSVMSHFVDMKTKGMLAPFTPATANLIRGAKLYDPEHYWHSVKLELTSLNYNKNLVSGDALPKTWKDLADPKYKGKIVQGHIKSSGDTALIAFNLVKMYGWDYFEALRKNDVLTMPACTQIELVARGERQIMMCDYSQIHTAQTQNLKMIDAVLPEDGVFMLAGPLAVLAKAPHPNAAKVLVNWLLSPEGQSIYVAGGDASSIESPDIKLPADFPDLKKYKLIDTDIDEFRKWLPEGTAKFVEMFGG
jgi:iron(III) transport system substrate-binding protein